MLNISFIYYGRANKSAQYGVSHHDYHSETVFPNQPDIMTIVPFIYYS